MACARCYQFGFCLRSWNSRCQQLLLYPSESPPLLTFFLMNSQLSNERKQQPLSLSFRANSIQRAATWFNKPLFSRFKLKSGFLSHSRSSSKSHSSSSLSSDPSLSRAQSSLTTTSKDNIYATTSLSVSSQAGVAIKKFSKPRQTLDAVSSNFETPQAIAIHSGRPIHSIAPQTTPDYRRPIPNFFATIPMVPGVSSLAFTGCPCQLFIGLVFSLLFTRPYTAAH